MRVVLLSNASLKHFPKNSLSVYTVRLPQRLDFTDGSYEIGLSEIQFYKSWFNVKQCSLTLKVNEAEETVYLDDGYYKSDKKLIKSINQAINDQCLNLKVKFNFYYNDVNKNFFVIAEDVRGCSIDITYSSSLEKILNVQEEKMEIKSMTDNTILVKYNTPIRLHTIFNLIVYTYVAKSSIVGDTQAQLLRVVGVEDGHWRLQSTNFNNVQYFKMNKTHVSSVSIYIYTDYGERVPFTHGRTVVTVDIQKVKPINLI